MKRTVILYVYFSFLIWDLVQSEDSCKKTSSCSCKFSNGAAINLNQLSNTDQTPRFEDQPDPDSNADMYSWNPCQPFNEGDCMDVAVCNVHNNIPNASYFTLGDQDSAVFSTSGKVTKLTYIYAGTGGAQRSAEITLTCDKDKEGSLDVKGEIPLGSGEYFFELQTKYACVDLGGISIGTIILIAFLCFIVVYLVLGMSIQTFVRKASGKQRIPNYSLWSTVPGLVKASILKTSGQTSRALSSKI
ncbi:Hypothetical predicted protein [Mytilus galloprovincialis]|uniref:Autophagy-related protein 27 n=1 Tax=Mytilus galloprovincialis TaxID=29158 RepID=A0A8B6FM39_MYTGA|nr:Hypothetical predicted protein [Mytilus galloprovincialis]